MTDKVPMPVSGGGSDKGAPDGVNDTGGRTAGGESGGAGYQNPHTGKDGEDSAGGFFGHGGQTDIGYHGGGQAGDKGEATPNANATARGSADGEDTGDNGPKAGPTGPDQDFSPEYAREIKVDGRKIKIIDTSGIAAAEEAGTTGVEGQKTTTEHPGSG